MKWAFLFSLITIFIINSYSQSPENREGMVMTVKGLITADSMGITLPHEHLLIVHKFNYLDLTDEATAITELGYYANAGGVTLAEASAIGIGRNPEGLKRISEATGIHVIMCTGYYKDQWIHDTLKAKSVQQLADIMINDIVNGINGIHAGFIKLGISKPITAFEEKAVLAAAHAQIITGVAIDLHFDGDRATLAEKIHVLDALENKGVDLSRVIISHNVPYVYLVDDFISLADRGCYIAFDMLGLEVRVQFLDELKLSETLNALIDAGYLHHLLMSQDVCFSVCYVRNGGYGYAHVLNNIVPSLKSRGITDAEIHTMMVDNPRLIFPFKFTGNCLDENFTAESGTISDNSGSADYYADMSCRKLIKVKDASHITLQFDSFETEAGYDFVRVYDGETTSSPLLAELSGNTLPQSIQSSGESMLITFTTDGGVEDEGWNASYYARILKTEPGSLNVEAGKGLTSIKIKSNLNWFVSETAGWLTAIKANDSTLSVVYDKNTRLNSRVAEIFVGAEGMDSLVVLLNQSGAEPYISITSESDILSAESGEITLKINSNIDWSATARSHWLTPIRSNDTLLVVRYDKNSRIDPRSAEIMVGDTNLISQVIKLDQTGADPELNIEPQFISVNADSGTTNFIVLSNINWMVNGNADWFEVTRSDDITISIRYKENLKVESRSADIIVDGPGVNSQVLRIDQKGAEPMLKISLQSITVSSDSGTMSFTVLSNINWSISEQCEWLAAQRTDDTTLAICYDENFSIQLRTTEILIGDTGTISQILHVNQNGADPVLTITPQNISVSADSGFISIQVTTNMEWSVIDDSEWLMAIRADSNMIVATYDQNVSLVSRSSEIRVAGLPEYFELVTFVQDAAIPNHIKPEPGEVNIWIFPNPVKDKAVIHYPGEIADFVELYDYSGRKVLVLKDTEKRGELTIDFSGLNSGMYIFRLVDRSGNGYNGKILKW